jgi:hypothetical protein
MAPKILNNSKFTKKLEIFVNWTVIAKFLKSQDSKTTFKQNLTFIFLSVRANLKKPKQFAMTDPVIADHSSGSKKDILP